MLQLIPIVAVLLSLAYSGLLWAIVRTWKKRSQDMEKTLGSDLFISVLVPARNESGNILRCVNAILQQDFPELQMEIIVIDDHSTDGTAELVKGIADQRVKVLQLADYLETSQNIVAYKKAALNLGVTHAKGDFIITTDADCFVDSGWIASFAAAFKRENKMVLAPVIMRGPDTFLTAFQGLDVAGTMLLTGVAVFWNRPLLANGANFGFSKKTFYDLDGYTGNEDQVSGDDVFLLQKGVQCKLDGINFLLNKEALVQTDAVDTWKQLFWQRLRWASKSSGYIDRYLFIFQTLVFLLNCLIWCLPFAFFFGAPFSLFFAILPCLIKSLADGYYLWYASKELGEPKWMNWFFVAFFLHSIYIVVIGMLAMLPIKPEWKGRK